MNKIASRTSHSVIRHALRIMQIPALALFSAVALLGAENFNSNFESGSPTPDVVTSFTIDSGQSCSPTQSYKLTSTTTPVLRDSDIASMDGYTRIRVFVTAWPSTLTTLLTMTNSGFTNLCQLQLDTDGTFNVAANSGTTDTSSTAVLTTGAWHVLQLAGDGSFSAGSDTCHGYLDGVEIGSGVTNASWSSNIEHVTLGGSNFSVDQLFADDWIIDDASMPAVGSCGSAPNNKYKSVVIGD